MVRRPQRDAICPGHDIPDLSPFPRPSPRDREHIISGGDHESINLAIIWTYVAVFSRAGGLASHAIPVPMRGLIIVYQAGLIDPMRLYEPTELLEGA